MIKTLVSLSAYQIKRLKMRMKTSYLLGFFCPTKR